MASLFVFSLLRASFVVFASAGLLARTICLLGVPVATLLFVLRTSLGSHFLSQLAIPQSLDSSLTHISIYISGPLSLSPSSISCRCFLYFNRT